LEVTEENSTHVVAPVEKINMQLEETSWWHFKMQWFEQAFIR